MTQQRFNLRALLVAFISIIAIAAILSFVTYQGLIMGTPQPGDPHHQLPRELVTQLFKITPAVQPSEGVENLYFSCTASEGSHCYFVPAEAIADFDFTYNPDIQNSANRIDGTLARQVLSALDIRHVERAKNNTVLLHCQRNAEGTLNCTINGGNERWYPVTLT